MLRRMARYVLDPRALLQVVSTGMAIHPEHQLVAPNSVRSEALSLLYEQVGRGALTEDEALRLHDRLTEVKMRLLGDRVSRERPGGSPASTDGTAFRTLSTLP